MRRLLLSVRRRFPELARKLQGALGVELVAHPITYHEDGLTSNHNADFLTDKAFIAAWNAAESTGSYHGWKIRWRLHVILCAAVQGLAVEGDFVECGVNLGGFTQAVIAYLGIEKLSRRRYYLLDTFNGLAEEFLSERERAQGLKGGGYRECYDEVRERFSQYPNVVIVRGAIPNTLPEVKSEKVAFLSIDMNNAIPEIAAAEYFWDRMSRGAMMVLDDYGWNVSVDQKPAFDRFAAKRGLQVMSLPTGQGLLVKP